VSQQDILAVIQQVKEIVQPTDDYKPAVSDRRDANTHVPPKVARSQFAPPSVAAASAQPLAPPTPVNVSTTAASAASTVAHASGTSHSGPPSIFNNHARVAARESTAALENSTQRCALNATERDDVLHALHLSYQANIIAEHPTFGPWKSDIHLLNVIASHMLH
jgi:hypothetical protein